MAQTGRIKMGVTQRKNIANILLKDTHRQNGHWREEKVVATDGKRIIHRLPPYNQSINNNKNNKNQQTTLKLFSESHSSTKPD